MNKIIEVLNTLENEPSTNKKLAILKANKDNDCLKKIFKYAYDKVDYSYHISGKALRRLCEERACNFFVKSRKVPYFKVSGYTNMFFLLDDLNNNVFTSNLQRNNAVFEYMSYLHNYNYDLIKIFVRIIDRDLNVGVSAKTLLKVWKDLIPKPNYCRCDKFSDSNFKKNIVLPCYVQLKCDGSYRECHVTEDGVVTFKTRSGEEASHPVLEKVLQDVPAGYYLGEFTIGRAEHAVNRQQGNGLLNSDNPPYDQVHFTVWDYLSDSDYTTRTRPPYRLRFTNLVKVVKEVNHALFDIVPTKKVFTLDEIKEFTKDVMSRGLEGSVIKDFAMEFKNGTSKQQLKFKLCIDCEMRCVGFELGQPDTKYENKNKVVVFANDEGTVKGTVSGLTDKMVDILTIEPERYLGKIFTLQFNDLLDDSSNKGYHSLSHPRFIDWREDKDETDTLEDIRASVNMQRGIE